jgi:hypothetical protein
MATTVKAKREIFSGIEEISIGVCHADGAHCCNDRKNGVISDEITLVQ